MGSYGWVSGKEPACQYKRCRFDPRVRKIPWRREWPPTPIFLLGKSHGQRSLAWYSPWGRKGVGHDLVTKQQQGKMRSYRKALTQNDWCLYRKRRLGHRHIAGGPREDRGVSIAKEKERLRRNQPCQHCDIHVQASRQWEMSVWCLSPSLQHFVKKHTSFTNHPLRVPSFSLAVF